MARWMRPDNFDHDSAQSFRRGGWWQYAVEEAKAIREGVGLIDATAFTKHVVKGPGATAFLDWFTCNKLPSVGRINLTYALTATAPPAPNTPSCACRREQLLPGLRRGLDRNMMPTILRKAAEDKMDEFGYIEIQDVTTQWGVFAIAGPKSRDVLAMR